MSKTATWYINCAVSLALMIFVRFIPAPEPMTQLGMTVVGIFIGAIYGWCTTNMIWPSIFALGMLAFTTGTPMPQIWGQLMSNGVVGIAFWLMLAVGFLSNTGLTEWIAQWSMTREFTKGKPWLLMTVIFLCAIVCASMLSEVAVTLLFWGLVWSMCEEVGVKKASKTAAWACFTVAALISFGGYMMPFKMAVVSNFGFLAAGSNGAYDGSYSYGAWLVFTCTLVVIVFVVWMLFSRFVLKINLEKFACRECSSADVTPLDRRQKICLALFGILFLLLMAPSFIPKGTALAGIVNTFNTVGFAMVVVAIGCMIKIDGEPLLVFSDLASKNVIWNIIFMFGTALLLSATINSPDAGVTALLKQVIVANMGGFPPIVFVVVFLLIGAAVTNVINNAVVGAILIPVSFSLCMAFEINPVALAACMILFADFGILLPSSSPTGALLHNNSGWIPRTTVFRYGFIMLTIMIVSAFVVGWPMANILFPFSA